MRPPNDMPSADRPPSQPAAGPRVLRGASRGRIILGAIVLALVVLMLSLRGLANFYTDFLWFDSLGYSSVWWNVLWAKLGLGLLFTAIFFVLVWLNLFLAERLAPSDQSSEGVDEAVQRFQQTVGKRKGLLRFGVSLLLAFLVGSGVSGRWEQWLFFVNSVDFGLADPQFGRDVGFYVFRLPFLGFLVSWGFTAVLIVFIFTAAWHFLNGAIRLQAKPGARVLPQVKAHLSLLLGLLALIKAVGYYLDQYALTLSTRGFVHGATYTDVKAQLPVLRLLMVISVFSFALLVVNIWRRGFTYPVIAVALWAVIAGLAGGVYPAIVQRFQVEPSESDREAPYIERNIDMTRRAMGLDGVQPREFRYEPDLTPAEVADNVETVSNVRLLDPAVMQDTFQQTQGIKSFYDFRDIDVDRYVIDGAVTQVVLSARELNEGDLPTSSWETKRLAYTHGYGVAAAPANAVDSNGRPAYVLGDIPAEVEPDANADSLRLETAGLYVGEGLTEYALVGAKRNEVDFQDNDDQTVETRYDGDGGVGVGSFLRRVAFALRFGEPNLVVSGELTGDSRLLYYRDVAERVRLLAPFLDYDADPYPVVLDGRVKWVLDAYTTTTQFPYAQRANVLAVRQGDLRKALNYVRNSIKVVVDAYNGSVTFYVVDPSDPLAQSYRQQFPQLFSDEEPSMALREHFRYPEDLFRLQSDTWSRYRIDGAAEFYDAAEAWSVAQDPGDSIGQAAVDTVRDPTTNQVIATSEVRIAPQYLLLRLPGEDSESFVIFRPFVPFSADDSRKNLKGFMVAHNDPDRYGQIDVYEIRSDQPIDGPALFNSNIQTEEEISERLTLLDQRGSKVKPGNLLLIPVENSLIYVRPLFIEAVGQTPVPELQLVIVGIGNEVVIAESFEAALERAVGGVDLDLESRTARLTGVGADDGTSGASGTPGDSDPDDGGDDGSKQPDDRSDPDTSDRSDGDLTVDELIAQAADALKRADEALKDGDLAGYQANVDEAAKLLSQAARQSQQQ